MATEQVNLGRKGSFSIKKGALHEMLGISPDKKIPEKRLESAEHSSNPLLAKRARSAIGLKAMRKG